MSQDTVTWLVQEIHDLLDAGPVGLYEFLWTLNSVDAPLPPEQQQAQARLALEQLIAEPDVQIGWMRWPESSFIGTVSVADLPAEPWQEPDNDGLYLAITRD